MGGIRRELLTKIDNNKLTAAMQKKDYGVVFISRVLGVSKSTVSCWKNGSVLNIPKDKYEALCALLGVESLAPDEKPKVKEEVAEPPKTESSVVSLEAHVDTKELDILKDIIKAQSEHITALCNSLQTAIDALNEVAGRDTAALSEITIEAVDSDFKAWKKEVVRCANKVVSSNKTYKSTNAALSEAYRLLRSQYGVVWEQEKKDFYEANGRAPVSTLELQYWIETTKPTHKNLLIAKLGMLCNKTHVSYAASR